MQVRQEKRTPFHNRKEMATSIFLVDGVLINNRIVDEILLVAMGPGTCLTFILLVKF